MVATCMNGLMRDVAPLPYLLHARPLAGPVRERRPVDRRPAAAMQRRLPSG